MRPMSVAIRSRYSRRLDCSCCCGAHHVARRHLRTTVAGPFGSYLHSHYHMQLQQRLGTWGQRLPQRVRPIRGTAPQGLPDLPLHRHSSYATYPMGELAIDPNATRARRPLPSRRRHRGRLFQELAMVWAQHHSVLTAPVPLTFPPSLPGLHEATRRHHHHQRQHDQEMNSMRCQLAASPSHGCPREGYRAEYLQSTVSAPVRGRILGCARHRVHQAPRERKERSGLRTVSQNLFRVV